MSIAIIQCYEANLKKKKNVISSDLFNYLSIKIVASSLKYKYVCLLF